MHTERQIDTLLARGETGSIFERLMDMPRPETREISEWDRAVSGRLEAHLARRMRNAIGAAQYDRDAA